MANANPATPTTHPTGWPVLDYAAGRATWEALHLWLQPRAPDCIG